MKYGKIIVKNDYEKVNDLVFRPLIRGYEKVGADTLMEDGDALLLGTIEDGRFRELFTRKYVDYDAYKMIDQLEVYYRIASLSIEKSNMIARVIDNVIFNNKAKTDFEISTMEDLAHDRNIEFHAYNASLTNHNVYSEPYNGYNDFGFKLQKVREYGK